MEKIGSQFWQLIATEHEKARAYCGRLAGNFVDGDDLYQDSVINAYNGFAGLRQMDSFKFWFYRIISNTYKGRFRNPWWRKIILRSPEIEAGQPSFDPRNMYDARKRLDYALSALTPDDRVLVTLMEIEGWNVAELAALMSRSEGSIKMRLMRSRRKMREKLSALYRKESDFVDNEGTKDICCAVKPKKD